MSGIQGGQTPAVVVPASIGRRIGAYVIDGAIGFGVVAVLGGVLAAVLQAVVRPTDEDGLAILILWITVMVFLVGLAWGLVYTAMQGGRGSLGQRALGLRVDDLYLGGRIGFWRALLRNIVWSLAGSIVVGYFTPLFDASGRHQGWHDMVARGVVADARETDAARVVPPVPRLATANPYLPPPAGAVASAPPLPPAPPSSFAPGAAGFAPGAAAGFAPAAAPAHPPVLDPAAAVPPGVGSRRDQEQPLLHLPRTLRPRRRPRSSPSRPA